MARPTLSATRDRAAEEAENLIRDALVQLTAAAIKTALMPAEVELVCQHCKKKTKGEIEGTSADTALILKLLERVAGKATEKRDTGVSGSLEKLLEGLSSPPGVSSSKTATELAEEAKERARKRATIAAALKGAAVTP